MISATMKLVGGMNISHQTVRHMNTGGDQMKETFQIMVISLLAVLSILALPVLYLFGF